MLDALDKSVDLSAFWGHKLKLLELHGHNEGYSGRGCWERSLSNHPREDEQLPQKLAVHTSVLKFPLNNYNLLEGD